MPLRIGGDETERPQTITFDPAKPNEVVEAQKTKERLLARGFIIEHDLLGNIRMLPPKIEEHHNIIRVISQNGDDRLVWDRRNPDEVKEAFAKFKDFLSKGYTAYTVGKNGQRGHKITEFHPGLEEVLMSAKEMVMHPPTRPG